MNPSNNKLKFGEPLLKHCPVAKQVCRSQRLFVKEIEIYLIFVRLVLVYILYSSNWCGERVRWGWLYIIIINCVLCQWPD